MKTKKLRLKLDRETLQPLELRDVVGGIASRLTCPNFTCNPCTATTCGTYIC